MLEVRGLTVVGRHGAGLLDGVSLSLRPGEAVGLTGPSGAGKTTLLRAILGLSAPGQRITAGSILADGQDLGALSPARRRALCGTVIGFIPQSPMTAFDSRLRIGRQIEETLRLRLGLRRDAARALAIEKLRAVNLPDPLRVWDSRAGQLSGGMLQRVTVALLLAMQPRYILADEPTSALDEENRDILLGLMKRQLAHAGLLLISHDAQAIRALCTQTLILHNGAVAKRQDTKSLFLSPRSPWTQAFVRCGEDTMGEAFAWKAL